MQSCISININHMGLDFKITLEQELDQFMMSKARAEMERNMVFIVLSIYCNSTRKINKVIFKHYLSMQNPQ